MLKPTQVLQTAWDTAAPESAFQHVYPTTYCPFSQGGHTDSTSKPSVSGHLSLALQKQDWGQTLLCGLISVSSLIKKKKNRLSHWYKRNRTWALEEASPAESLTKLKKSHNSCSGIMTTAPVQTAVKCQGLLLNCLLCPNYKQKRNVSASLNFIRKHMDFCYHGNKSNTELLSFRGAYKQK